MYCILLLIPIAVVQASIYEVKTSNGRFKGAMNLTRDGRQLYSFRGIRYAEPPVGRLRFMEPVPARKLEETFDATMEGPACPQLAPLTQSEDCLRLNIYTPKLPINGAAEQKYPVIVYIHTGSFYEYSGQSSLLGPEYLLDQDIVLVTINYRLGALGFLSTGDELAPGNLGLKDQVVALEWIQQNIVPFGGDRNSVTLAGTGAGAWSISLHLVSPMSVNLFHRVILASGAATYQTPLPNHQKHLAIKQAQLLNCPHNSSNEIVGCLRTRRATEIANTLIDFYEWREHPILIWTPVVEPNINGKRRFLTHQPASLIRAGKFYQVPVIVGITEGELSPVVASFIEQARNGKTQIFDDLNDNWTELAPKLLWYESGTQRSRDISAALKKLYFGTNRIQLGNSNGLQQMFTDVVGYSAHRFVNLVSKVSTKPVYYYKFSYQSHHSHYTWSNGTAFGTCHSDDLLYLFYSIYFPFFYYSDLESQTLERMTMIWATFAKTGQPVRSFHKHFENLVWNKFTPESQKYLNIGNDLIMETNLNADRMQEWDKLFNF